MQFRNKIYTIEVYRLVFILLIAVMHFREDWNNTVLQKAWYEGAWLGVDFFFILSGFFLMKHFSSKEGSLHHQQLKGEPYEESLCFVWHKAAKLYPEYFISILLMIAVKGFFSQNWLYAFKDGFINRWLQFVFLHAVNIPGSGQEMRSIWYLSPLLVMSFIIYYILAKNKDFYIGAIAIIANFFVIVFLMNATGTLALHTGPVFVKILPGGLLRAFMDMNIGILVWIAAAKLAQYSYTKLFCFFMNVIEWLSLINIFKLFASGGYSIDSYKILIYFSVLILCSWNQITILSKVMNRAFLGRISSISYSIYLIHLVIGTVLLNLLQTWPWDRILPLYVVCIVIAGIGLKYIANLIRKSITRIRLLEKRQVEQH